MFGVLCNLPAYNIKQSLVTHRGGSSESPCYGPVAKITLIFNFRGLMIKHFLGGIYMVGSLIYYKHTALR